MRILFLSSVYPRPGDPTHGVYTHHLCRALAAEHEVRVISPRSWLERLRHGKADRPRGRAEGRGPGQGEPEVTYPTYYYPPGLLHDTHGWFLWASVRKTVRRVLAEFSPDCVLSYWVYPDGAAAV